jgi:hypothetical protein
MSGGSMRYLYQDVLLAVEIDSDEGEGGFLKNTELRKLFAAHLKDVAAALKAIEWNDSGDGASDEDELILNCFKFFPSQTMNNGPRSMTTEVKSPETMSVLPPMGWVKLPSGESFAVADVVALGAIQQSFDSDEDLAFFFFNIQLVHSTVKCALYDIESSLESEAEIRERLEHFRDQIAIARWGEHCIGLKDEDKKSD